MHRNWSEIFLKSAVLLGLLAVGLGIWSDILFVIFIIPAFLCCITSLGLVINRKDN